jgi:hypothetical protein
MANDVAMMSRVAAKAIVTMTTAGTGTPTLNAHESQWGVSVAPTIARTGVGVYTITWPATVTDQLGNTQALNLRFVAAISPGGAFAGNILQASVTAPNVVTVYQVQMGGGTPAAADSTGQVFTVFAF